MMTNKEYRCQNGDLIEVGKEYRWRRNVAGCAEVKVEVLKILPEQRIVTLADWHGLKADIDRVDEFQSLWQEQPDENEDKIIKKLTIQTEYEQLKYTKALNLTEVQSIFDWLGKKYNNKEAKPDADGWIKHTTGKQPVADDVMVEVKIGGFTSDTDKAECWGIYWEDGKITHYRLVKDKQESEQTFMQLFKSVYNFSHYHTEAQQVIEAIGATIDKYLQKKGI